MRETKLETRPPGGDDWRRATDVRLLMRALHSTRPIELWHPDWQNETRFISLQQLILLNTQGMWWRVA